MSDGRLSDEELAREIARECAAVGTLAYEVAMEASKLALAAGIAKGRHLERAEFVCRHGAMRQAVEYGCPDCPELIDEPVTP